MATKTGNKASIYRQPDEVVAHIESEEASQKTATARHRLPQPPPTLFKSTPLINNALFRLCLCPTLEGPTLDRLIPDMCAFPPPHGSPPLKSSTSGSACSYRSNQLHWLRQQRLGNKSFKELKFHVAKHGGKQLWCPRFFKRITNKGAFKEYSKRQ